MGTRYFRNWFYEPNGNDDFRLSTKAQEGARSTTIEQNSGEKRLGEKEKEAEETVENGGSDEREGKEERRKGKNEDETSVGCVSKKRRDTAFQETKPTETYPS